MSEKPVIRQVLRRLDRFETTLDEFFKQVLRRLDRLESLAETTHVQGVRIMADLSALQAQVAANTDVEKSAVTLIKGLADQLAAAGTDPAALASLQSQLKASADALAAAVTANTPAAPSTP